MILTGLLGLLYASGTTDSSAALVQALNVQPLSLTAQRILAGVSVLLCDIGFGFVLALQSVLVADQFLLHTDSSRASSSSSSSSSSQGPHTEGSLEEGMEGGQERSEESGRETGAARASRIFALYYFMYNVGTMLGEFSNPTLRDKVR